MSTRKAPVHAAAATAAASSKALHTRGAARRELLTAYGINLAANVAWSYLFFGRRSTLGGLAGTLALDAGNADLVRRANSHDPVAARALLPYAAWCVFATALNASIAARNR
jgi:benzodiazapine receptor